MSFDMKICSNCFVAGLGGGLGATTSVSTTSRGLGGVDPKTTTTTTGTSGTNGKPG